MRALLLAGLLLNACGGDGPAGEAPRERPRAVPEGEPASAPADLSHRYVVPLSRSTGFAQALGISATSTFEPDAAAVEAFEAELDGFLRTSELPAAPRIAAALPSYRRQFVGIEIEGHILIVGNFFRTDDDARQPVAVDDGGEAYFQIRYEPKTKKFSGLMINGEA